MNKIVIIAAGGHAREIAAYLLDDATTTQRLVGAFDDACTAPAVWHGSNLLGKVADLARFCAQEGEVEFIIAVGKNEVRRSIALRIESMGLPNLKPWTVRHHTAWTGWGVGIGAGTLLAPNSIVTTNSQIGRHSILNVKASVSHDCKVGDYCNLNPNSTICGNVQLGDGCDIGAGATVIESRRIGAWSVIGAGAVVTEDLPEGVTAVGVPARIIRRQGIPNNS